MNDPKISYKAKELKITKETIKQFHLLEDRRRLKENKVKGLKENMLNGIHFEAPIVVNEKGDKLRVIDGQHRIIAIQKAMKEQKDFQITILLIIYTDSTIEEEREIFNRWNSGSRQSAEDFIMMFAKTIPLIKWVEEFPYKVTVYKEKGCLPFRNMAASFIAAKNMDKLGHTGVNKDFIKELKEISPDDFEVLTKFYKGFKENIVKEWDNKNCFCNCSALNALTYIYYYNQNVKDLWERIKSRFIQNEKFILLAKNGGRLATRTMIDEAEEVLNAGYKEQIKIPDKRRALNEEEKAVESKKALEKLVKTFSGKKKEKTEREEIEEFIVKNYNKMNLSALRNEIGSKFEVWLSPETILKTFEKNKDDDDDEIEIEEPTDEPYDPSDLEAEDLEE